MATALAATRLQRPQQEGVDVVHKYMEVVHGMREFGNTGVRVRAASTLGGYQPKGVASESRGRICRVPLFRTPAYRRATFVSAMSEGERDITDMQETDKVSGEWWQSVLTAVHEWSADKLLGLAELADGSLFFSFGGSDTPRPAKPPTQSRAKSETKMNGSTHNVTPTTLPQRHPSSFRKHSPIPAARKKASVSKDAPSAQPPAETKKTPKGKTPSQPARPQRPASFFSKRSPIPKDRDSIPASTSEKKSPSTKAPNKSTAAVSFDPAKDSPFSTELKEILSHGKEAAGDESKDGAKSKADLAKSSSGAPAKKKSSKIESDDAEVAQGVENGALIGDLGSYKLPELRSLAKARGLKGYSKLKKGELVDLLASSES